MSNLAIFKNPGAVAASALPPSKLGQQIAENSVGGYNRIATNTNGTFKRIVNGEQVGKAIRGEFNAIIVDMLEKPSREYYAGQYDPDAKGTLPDCFSALGDKPDAKAKNRQGANCASCAMNIDGSGQNGKGKACRFKRKIALLLEGDTSGEVYQFNVPAKSLFGKGNGVVHPFESYCRFLVANGAAPDRVVTTIAYNLDAETMELQFSADRFITEEELAIVEATQTNPMTRKLIQLSVGETEKPKALPAAVEEEEEEPAPAIKPAAAAKPANKWDDAEDDEDEAPSEPAKRASKKDEAPKLNTDLGSLVDSWAEDGDEG